MTRSPASTTPSAYTNWLRLGVRSELSVKSDQISQALDPHDAMKRARLGDQFNRLADILAVELAGRVAGRVR